jgi:hypothetical protein
MLSWSRALDRERRKRGRGKREEGEIKRDFIKA